MAFNNQQGIYPYLDYVMPNKEIQMLIKLIDIYIFYIKIRIPY